MRGKPNIILITLDSLRSDFVGYQNSKEKNTPFLDSLANKSTVFTNAISPANPTFFTFCSLMTGTIPFYLGKYLGVPDSNKIKTIAESLRENGYSTYAFLADSPALYYEYGYNKGFDYYDDGYEETDNKFTLSFGEKLWKIRQAIPDKILGFFEPLRSLFINAFTLKKTLVSGRKLNKKIKEAIKDLDDQPFFLWLHYMDSHLPYLNGLGPSFFNKNNKLKKLIKRIIFYMSLSTSVRRMSLSNSTLIEIFKEAYRTSVKYLDKCLKEIIDFILKKYPNTIIVIASDHGEAFMEHDFFAHEPMSLHNEIIKVPLMFYIPKNKPKIIKNTVSLVSVAKTIASLVGINELKFQGDDLLKNKNYSLINNISRILYNCRSPHVRLGILDNKTEIKGKYTQLWSFTTPKEKYIYELDGNRREFYDLDKDPLEKKNLYSDKIKSRIINQLEEMVHKTK